MSCSIEYNGQIYTPDEFKQYISDNFVDFAAFASKKENKVDYVFRSVKLLLSDKALKAFKYVKDGVWNLEKALLELQIPTAQRDLIMNLGVQDRDDIIVELLSNYSYTIEINTAKDKVSYNILPVHEFDPEEGRYEQIGFGVYTGNDIGQEPRYIVDKLEDAERLAKNEGSPTKVYSNLTVPGGTNYTENEIATPAITPSIKGHAQFSTDNGLMWSRTDERIQYQENETDKLLKIMENSGILKIKCS